MESCCSHTKVCLKYDYQFVDELTYKLKDKLNPLLDKKIKSIKFKYFCDEDIDSQINEINLFIRSLNRIKTSFLHIKRYCLPEDVVQAIIEKALKIAGKAPCPKNRKDINIDGSLLNSYLMSGPRCVTYDTWNKFSSYLCGKLGFSIKAEKEKCDLTFEITRNIVSCNLLFALSVRKELCNLGYTVKKTKDECKIEYKLFLERNPNCDLEYKMYANFVNNHQLTYPIINEVYESGLSLIEVDGEAVVCTPINNYKLTEITPTSLQELLDAGFVVTLNKQDIKQDFTK